MLRCFMALALLGVGADRSATPPSPWPLRHYVRWEPRWGSRTVSAAGLNARIEVKKCGEDRPASEGCFRSDPYLVVTVAAPGMAPVTLQGDPGVGAFVGIGKLLPDAVRPSLILISEDGGSAGCVQIDLAVPQGTAYRSIRLSADKSDHGTLCEVDPPRLAWPRDLTGHRRAEFLLLDTRFYCHFTSCAGSWYPPRVVALDGEQGVDVSADPALAPLYRADMTKARFACEHDEAEAQGACAGYAADASRLGRLPEAWRAIDGQVHRGCRVPHADMCPDINRVPSTFPQELATMLPKTR